MDDPKAIPLSKSLYLFGIKSVNNMNKILIINPNSVFNFNDLIYRLINGINANIFVISIIYFPYIFSSGFNILNNTQGLMKNAGNIKNLYILLLVIKKFKHGIIMKYNADT